MSGYMAERLGELLKARRRLVEMSQADVASHIPGGTLTLAMLNSIESGATRTMTPAAAKALVDAKVIPVTMTEIVQAMGYDLPSRHPAKKQELVSVVESLRPDEDEALRTWLRGLLLLRREKLETGLG